MVKGDRWHVVQCAHASDKSKKARNWTLSLDPEEPGWDTDGGYCTSIGGYGLPYRLAKELADAADAANAAWRVKQRNS